jgi:1,4-dihydroxy-6-naphthoate synthase
MTDNTLIRVAHSPDSDDAFMFWALSTGRVETEGLRYEHVLKDIETLNKDAETGTYEVTALSIQWATATVLWWSRRSPWTATPCAT